MKKILLFLFILSFKSNSQCLWNSIHSGASTVVGLKEDNTIWKWGYIGSSQYDVNEPVQIGNDSDWSKLSTGYFHTLAIKADGTLWAWGQSFFGQLGIPYNPNNDLSLPTQVGTDSDWVDISAGSTHSCAIKSNGTLWAWGYNDFGQLGDGTWVQKNLPTQIGNDTDWKKVETSSRTTIAIKVNNTLWGWGQNNAGQLGNGNYLSVNSPVQIGGNSSDWKSVRAGDGHCLALKNDNTLWAWGNNYYGNLGNGTNINENVPIQIGSSNNWKDIGLSAAHSIALKEDNTLWSWGANDDGQLGDNTLISKNTPEQVGTENDWDKIINYASGTSFCIKNNKTLWGFGSNYNGQLLIENNSTSNSEGIQIIPTPTSINCFVVSVLSTENLMLNKEFSIYPNPSSNSLNILNTTNKKIDKLIVSSTSGQKLHELNNPLNQIDVSNLPNGIYFICLKCENEVYHLKFIKE